MVSGTPMSKERLEVLEHDGHLARVEALTTTSATLGHELQDACREIRRVKDLALSASMEAAALSEQLAALEVERDEFQKLVDELGDALLEDYRYIVSGISGLRDHSSTDHLKPVRDLLIRAGKLEKEDVR